MVKGKSSEPAGRRRRHSGVTSRLFWEEKADDYTLPFDEESLAYTNSTVSLMESAGVRLEGARILDIGSGPGTFALPLALRGASVTALDISENMLKRLAGEAGARGITGIETIRASWKEFDPLAAGCAGAFDIVLSALSLAIETEEDIIRMEKCSRHWCVCVATGNIERHAPCEDVLRALNLPLVPRPDIRDIRQKVEAMGRAPFYRSVPLTRSEEKTLTRLSEDLVKRTEAQGRRPDRRAIRDALSPLFSDVKRGGVIECTWRSERGVLMWNGEGKNP